MKFRALLTKEVQENIFEKQITEVAFDFLPDNEIMIKVHYSSLNYKDALTARGHKGIARKYPRIPGIDSVGEIVESRNPNFRKGEMVIVHGHDLGMNTNGGFGQFISVPSEWITPLPPNMTPRQSMMYGTAGFTAALCINEIINHQIDKNQEILVTGASGGVGILAIGMLAKLGYKVAASSGKKEFEDKLYKYGAYRVIPREEVVDLTERPMLGGRWVAVIENVGGNTLNTAIKRTKMDGIVFVIGNITGDKIDTTVYPFILRGIKLIGINSASKDMALRNQLWHNMANEWNIPNLEDIVREVKLDNLIPEIDKMLLGQLSGRVIVNLLD